MTSRTASWGRRAAAALIDTALVIVLPLLFTALVWAMFAGGYETVSDASGVQQSAGMSGGSSPAGLGIVLAGAVVALIVAGRMAYRQGESGQTPGKRALGLVTVGADGDVLGGPAGLRRGAAQLVNIVPLGAGYLRPLWSGDRQTWADRFVGSTVVDARR
ncbi:RDD family protein [Actinoplanes xinjiangensis]|uniref:RDD family protein n=1 Tax=Actinoplanes xinjiangensis TaxID=512350 RepID=A0A316FMS3_9ACTN|nr:RDD family protein [Actinoplanes xinjiangensis]PWK50201.1 RDD family protein [Actinoplanes xinjiangensis]GIF36089.1 hypothetical protein Axi01nite_04000 [Actinoplanes xinjiangensis]